MFIECLILSVRERHGISGKFTTNGLELKYCLQKKMIVEEVVPKEIVEVSKALKRWIQSYYSKVRQAIRGLGKYRLAPEFLNFYVELALWLQWPEERRNQHYEALLRSIPQVLEYSKPNLLVKSRVTLERTNQEARPPEPELFIERADIDDVSENITTSKEKSTGNSKSVEQVCIQIKRLIALFD